MYKVFLVDDEPFIIEGMHHIVDWQEFGLVIAGVAQDGKAALDALKQQQVDLLITDISMPEMNGLQLIRELRSFMPDLKIIVLSGFNEFDYLKEGMKYGIENYLLKPINVQELKDTLQITINKLNAPYAQRWLDNDISILRENILYRWVAGQISYLELKERASLLQIDIAAPYYMTAMLRCKEQAEACYVKAAQAMEAMRGDTVHVFRDFAGNTILLFALHDPLHERTRALAELKQLQQQLANFKLRITLGSAKPAFSGAAISYTEAQQAQDYFLIMLEQNMIDCELLQWENEEKGCSFVFPWPIYVKLIHSGDAAGLDCQIEQDIGELCSQPDITPTALRATVTVLLRLLHDEQNTEEELQPNQQLLQLKELDAVVRTTDIGELIALVQESGKRLLSSLPREKKSPVVAGVLDRIHASYDEPLSLKQLGGEYNVHPVYLGQLFQKETGSSFNDYLNRYRIDKAKELLRQSRRRVQEIALKVGYTETGYFYKQFKKYVGVSPVEYKEMH